MRPPPPPPVMTMCRSDRLRSLTWLALAAAWATVLLLMVDHLRQQEAAEHAWRARVAESRKAWEKVVAERRERAREIERARR